MSLTAMDTPPIVSAWCSTSPWKKRLVIMKRELLTRILEGIWKKYNFHLIWTRKFEFMMINYDDTKWNGRNLYKRPAANSISSVCPRWTFLALCHIGWGCTARGRHLTIWIMVITQTPKSEKTIFWAAPPALSLRRCPGEHSRQCHTWLLIYITIQYLIFWTIKRQKILWWLWLLKIKTYKVWDHSKASTMTHHWWEQYMRILMRKIMSMSLKF